MSNLARPGLIKKVPPIPLEPRIGSIVEIDGLEYTIERFLGSGGLARVYQATDPNHKPVAVKIYKPSFPLMEGYLKRGYDLRREYSDIPGIQFVLPHSGDMPFASVYNYVEGESAESNAERKTLEERILQARTLIAKTMPILELLINRGLAHRDIKGDNLLVSPSGQHVTLLDFDFLMDVNKPVKGELLVGTPLFFSPEQADADQSLTMDIFGLGATVLYTHMNSDTQDIANIGERNASKWSIIKQRKLSPSTKPKRVQERLLNLDRFPENIRAEVYGLICFLIAALQPNPKDRPKNLKEVEQLLAAVPNNTMNYGITKSAPIS